MNMNIHELKEYRDKHHVFADRRDAGMTLGSMIKAEYGSIKDGLVLAIPSGGVPVGIAVSKTMDTPFDLIIVRKLQIPGNPEAGFGAMTLDGCVIINELLRAEFFLSPTQIQEEEMRVHAELESRNNLFREGRPFPALKGKTVILVDDGIASGYTMMASIHTVKREDVLQIIVAVPTAPVRSLEKVAAEVDAVFCPNIRSGPYFAVADAYRLWYDLNQQEVIVLLKRASMTKNVTIKNLAGGMI
ncbi:MAG: phosphoribosyltransferase [Deltaproteobacteria bacterium]|nr:phosphoribosyltransferase [Deltaproteobacteria bacterium]